MVNMSQLPATEVYEFIDGFANETEFFEFARGCLAIENNQLKDISDDYLDSREQKYQTICLWKRKTGQQATMERLCQLKAEFYAPLDDDENSVDGSSSNEEEQPNGSPYTPRNQHMPTTADDKASLQVESAPVSSAPSHSSNVPAAASEVSHQQLGKSYQHDAPSQLSYQKPVIFVKSPTWHKGPIAEGSSVDVSLLNLSLHSQSSEAPLQQHPYPLRRVNDASSALYEELNSEEWLKNMPFNKIYPEPTSKALGSSPPEVRKSSTHKKSRKSFHDSASAGTEMDNNIPDQLGVAANPDISIFCDEVANLKVETCSPEEKRFIDAKDCVYEIKSRPKGYALIINNNFKETKGYRVSAASDVKNMKELWLSLECSVNVQQDKSADELRTILQTIAKSGNIKKYDFFVLFIMSHGRLTREGEAFKTADAKYVTVEEILQIFDTENTLNLIGKPKLFFFQFCRGKETDMGFSKDDQEFEIELFNIMQKASKSDSDLLQQDYDGDVHPIRCDLFISYATQLGFKSFDRKGSWFINAIANVFARYAKEEHVAEMMLRVREALRAKTGIKPQSETANIPRKEMSESRDLFSKKLYLLPGYPEDDLLSDSHENQVPEIEHQENDQDGDIEDHFSKSEGKTSSENLSSQSNIYFNIKRSPEEGHGVLDLSQTMSVWSGHGEKVKQMVDILNLDQQQTNVSSSESITAAYSSEQIESPSLLNSGKTFSVKVLANVGNQTAETSLCDEVVHYIEVDSCPDEVFKQMKLNPEYYPVMDKSQKGHVLIFNNTFRDVRGHKPRTGSLKDVKNLKKLWKDIGGCKVTEKTDLGADNMLKELKEFVMSKKRADCGFVCFFIMSHGSCDYYMDENDKLRLGEGCILGNDGKVVGIAEITQMLDDTFPSTTLQNTPKLVFFQICSGSIFGSGNEQSCKAVVDTDTVTKLPIISDTLISHATQSGYKSLHDSDSGSWYINAIVNTFNRYAKDEHVVDLMTRVNEAFSHRLRELETGEACMEMSTFTSNLRKKLFFYPGQENKKEGDFSSMLRKISIVDNHMDIVNGKLKSLTTTIELSTLSNAKKTDLLLELSQRQILIGSWESALQSAKMGLTLLESADKFHIRNKLLNIGLCCCAGEASRALHKMRDFANYLYKSQNMMEFLPAIEDPELREKHEQVNGIYQKMKQSGLRDGTVCNRHSSCKFVDTYRGKISVADAAINFSKGSFKNSTAIELATTLPDSNNALPELLPASPILRLTPTMDLGATAEVTLQTWALANSTTMETEVLYRESEEDAWKFHANAKIDHDGKVRFSIWKFCEYAIYVKIKMNWDFRIKSCLFAGIETKKLTNRLVQNCATCIDSLTEKMSKRNFVPVCSGDPTLTTKIDDEVRVELKNIRDDRYRGDLPPKSAMISEMFLREGDHILQDFLLPRDCQRIVDFTHSITHFHNRDLKDFVSHEEDSISLDPHGQRTYLYSGKRGKFLGERSISMNVSSSMAPSGKFNMQQPTSTIPPSLPISFSEK